MQYYFCIIFVLFRLFVGLIYLRDSMSCLYDWQLRFNRTKPILASDKGSGMVFLRES
jgi:hypothetical protein